MLFLNSPFNDKKFIRIFDLYNKKLVLKYDMYGLFLEKSLQEPLSYIFSCIFNLYYFLFSIFCE